ncbi:MAG: DNA-binding transcriptional LysR family regulator [Gammaproteobacteria bacterium]|jgi:DNA-binding transcriptional LysR family regulator
MIELHQLRAFVAVAEESHFGRAAERLGQSQPSLSRSVKAIERILDAPLFHRTTRSVELTPAGEVFLPRARTLLVGLTDAMDEARRASTGVTGRLVVSFMDFAILGVLPALVAGFRQHHPEVDVDLRYSWTERQRCELLAGEVDLGFLIGPFNAAGIHTQTVDRQRFVAVLPETHPLASRPHLRLSDLSEQPFVFGAHDEWGPVRTTLNRLCHAAGFSPRVVQETHSRDGIFGFVAAGLGVTLYTEVALNSPRRGVVIVPLIEVQEQIDVVAAWRTAGQPPALRRFLEHLGKALQI